MWKDNIGTAKEVAKEFFGAAVTMFNTILGNNNNNNLTMVLLTPTITTMVLPH